MIISQKKPDAEILDSLKDAANVVLIGCSECATVCQTGSEEAMAEMKVFLEENGKKVTCTIYPKASCNKLAVKKDLKDNKEAVGEAQAILTMSCGDGCQTVASNTKLPVYPANDTMFLGEVERVGLFTEACRFCGQCVLASTGAICPITKCAKSLTNGPCGGAKDGMCEVNPNNKCGWILIYNRMTELGQLDRLEALGEPKGYLINAYPREINLRGEKNE